MAHQRKLIRKAVIQRLKDANTACGQRVFGNRARQIFQNELPCLLVYTQKEPVEISVQGPREYKRSLQVAVEIVAKADDDLDDSIDDIAEQVEAAIFTDETFGDLASDTILGDTDIDIIDDGEKPIGAAKILLTIPYYQRLPELVPADMDDFKTATMVVDVAPGDGQVESTDSITLPQS